MTKFICCEMQLNNADRLSLSFSERDKGYCDGNAAIQKTIFVSFLYAATALRKGIVHELLIDEREWEEEVWLGSCGGHDNMVHPSCFAPKRKIACGATMVWGKAHPYCRYCASPNTYPFEDHVRHQSVKKRTPVFVWNYARNRNVLEAKGMKCMKKVKYIIRPAPSWDARLS